MEEKKDNMRVELSSPSESRQLIRGKLRTGNWWLFISVGERGSDMRTLIENKYYSGKKNKDFDLIIGTHPEYGMAVVCLGAKKHLPMSVAGRMYKDSLRGDAIPLEHLETRNVITLTGPDGESDNAKIMSEATRVMLVFGLEPQDLDTQRKIKEIG